MAEDTRDDFLLEFMKHAIDKAGKSVGYNEAKELQWKVIAEVASGHDVFAVLPTGFGKSFCYGCLLLVFDEMISPSQPSIVCVISPLTAIIEDQVAYCSYNDCRSCFLFYGSVFVHKLGV